MHKYTVSVCRQAVPRWTDADAPGTAAEVEGVARKLQQVLTAVQEVQDKSQQRLTETPAVQDRSQQRLTQVQVVQHFSRLLRDRR